MSLSFAHFRKGLAVITDPNTSGETEMTNDEFDQAIEAIRQDQITPREGRVIAAAVFVMRELRNIPQDQAWDPTHTQIIEFI